MRRTLGLVAVLALFVGCGAAPPAGSPTNPDRTTNAVSSSVTPPAAPTTSGTVAQSDDQRTAAGATELTGKAATGGPDADGSPAVAPTAVTPVSRPAQATAVIALLDTLAVKGRAPKTGYDRAMFGPAWTDDVTVDAGHNGCDTRNDILRRDLVDLVIKPDSNGCTVLSGVLHDPYTGRTIDFRRGTATSGAVQIDHVVSLSDAWQTGAQALDLQRREDLANDPLNLQAVDGPTNEAKGDGDAATWLPPNKSYRCTYVSRQVQVKARYGLWVTGAEKAAIERILAGCGALIPPSTAVPLPSISRTSTPARTTTQTPASSTRTVASSTSGASPVTPNLSPPATKSQGCQPLSAAGNCYEPGQFCAKKDHGTTGVDADGEAITCRQVGSRWRWERS